jgi:hypothetical protein
MAAVFALVIPRLRDPGRTELEAQSHHLVLAFRLLRSEAVLNGAAYRLNYDLDQQRYWVSPGDASIDLAQFARDIGALARGTRCWKVAPACRRLCWSRRNRRSSLPPPAALLRTPRHNSDVGVPKLN